MVSLWQIFLVFAKIGAFTIGGGIPMIAAIKSELVERKWLNDEDFVDIITLAQTAPGLFAVNISILTGHKLRGTKGSVVATIASCLPPFLMRPYGSDILHGIQGQSICNQGIQGNQTRGGGIDRSTYDRYVESDKDEVVVLGRRDFFNDTRLLPQGLSYIYIDMRHRRGGIHQLV